MTDPYLDQLKTSWQSQGEPVDVARIARLYRRQHRAHQLRLAAETGGALLALVSGLWFAAQLLEAFDALYLLGAVAMLTTLLVVVYVIRIRMAVPAAESGTPGERLGQLQNLLRMEIRLLNASRWGVVTLLACAFAALGLWLAQQIPVATAAQLAGVWTATAAGLGLWSRYRRARLNQQLSTCQALLKQSKE